MMPMVSHSFSASLITWVEKSTVLPCSRHSRMNPMMAARGHDVEAAGRLVEDHDRRIVHQRARDGDFLLHAGRELVAAAMTEFVHLQALEERVDAAAQGVLVESVEAAEIFDHLLRGKAPVERRRGGKKTDVSADFLGIARMS